MGDLIDKLEQDHIILNNSNNVNNRFKKSEIEAKAKISAINNAKEL